MTNLKHIRTAILGLTMAELAAIAGTSQAKVWRWEAGETEPRLSEIAAIKRYADDRGLELPLDFLLGLTEQQPAA